MREIKFRYWDTIRKEFITAGDVYLLMNGRVLAGDMDNLPLVDITENVVKIQYTGLKDKNGREIFEGDIIGTWEQDEYIPERDSGGGIVGYDVKEGFSQIGIVAFNNAWFTYETKKHIAGRKEKIYAPLDFTNDLFIVGNVYENPELLKGE